MNGERRREGHGTLSHVYSAVRVLGLTTCLRIYDGGNTPDIPIYPGELPPSTDPPLKIPDGLPRTTPPSEQERYLETPVYETLT
jgi:hypothetical protein